jgi:hypothetical protein
MIAEKSFITDTSITCGALVIIAGVLADRYVLRTCGVVAERAYSDGCVLKSSRADNHCAVAYGRISVTAGIAKEGAFPYGRVERTGGVTFKGLVSHTGVVAAGCIATQGKGTGGGVETGGVVDERSVSIGGVAEPAHIAI